MTMESVKQRFNPSPNCPLPCLVVSQPLTTPSIKRSLQLWQLLSIFGYRTFFLGFGFRVELFFYLFHFYWVWSSFWYVLLTNYLFKKVTSEPGYQPLWTCLPLDNCHLVYNKTTVHYRPIWSQLLHPSNPHLTQKVIKCIFSHFCIKGMGRFLIEPIGPTDTSGQAGGGVCKCGWYSRRPGVCNWHTCEPRPGPDWARSQHPPALSLPDQGGLTEEDGDEGGKDGVGEEGPGGDPRC